MNFCVSFLLFINYFFFYRFLYCSVGANGKQSDGGIYNRSNFKKLLEEGKLKIPKPRRLPESRNKWSNFHICGDDAFGLKFTMMKPYPGNVEGTLQQKIDMRIFDYRLVH